MGNRYTRTTLTKRQLESLESAYRKVRTIYDDRAMMDSPNEAGKPIKILRDIIIHMRALEIAVRDERDSIERGE